MPLITLRLDRVFDVVYVRPKNGNHTLFSFESDGHRHFGVMLPGRLTLRDGMVVTALLARENDWQSLQGWRDHETGEVVHDATLRELMVIPFAVMLAIAAANVRDSNPVGAALLVLAGIALVASGVYLIGRRFAKFEQLRDTAGR
jgi:hypothetical protein